MECVLLPLIRCGLVTATAALAAFGAFACRGPTENESKADIQHEDTATSPAHSISSQAGADAVRAQQELLTELWKCDIRDRGIVLDLGVAGLDFRKGFSLGPFDDTTNVERGGETFARFHLRKARYFFWLAEKQGNLRAEVRVHGGAAPRVGVTLDSKRLGLSKLEGGKTSVIRQSVPFELEPGLHSVEIGFVGGKPAAGEAYGEVDWIRLSDRGETFDYPPTQTSVVSEVALGDVPHRVLALKAGQSVRCPIHLDAKASFSTAVGFWGKGKGEASLNLLTDGHPPRSIWTRRVSGGEGATFTPVELGLGDQAPLIGTLELTADSGEGGRVVFGDPVLRSEKQRKVVRTPLVVVLVASGLRREHVPPWGSGEVASALGELRARSVAFSSYRVPSTLPAAVMASLLSGLSSGAHGVRDTATPLDPRVMTVHRALKAVTGRAAFMTGVPSTFAAFGFGTDWGESVNISPVLDLPATEVLSRATAWLKQQRSEIETRPHLLVVHSRGAHPPWDVSKIEAQKLLPKEYGGNIDARRGGVEVGLVRRREARLKEGDLQRILELEKAALVKEGVAIRKLLSTLQTLGLYDQALIVYMGDVGAGPAGAVPYPPQAPLDEEWLSVPLLVKFPGNLGAGTESQVPLGTEDLGMSIALALGLDPLPDSAGIDLQALIENYAPPTGRALLANRGEAYALKAGAFRLFGSPNRAPRLCRLDRDPACAEDVFGSSAHAARTLWLMAFEQSLHTRKVRDRIFGEDPPKPVDLDEDTRAALIAWGDMR